MEMLRPDPVANPEHYLASGRAGRGEMARSDNRPHEITDQEDFWNNGISRPNVKTAVFEPWDGGLKSERHKIRLTIRSQHEPSGDTPRALMKLLGHHPAFRH